jgi:hypothetical protein
MERKEQDTIIPDVHFARISDKQGDTGEFRLMLEIFRDGLASAMSWKRQEPRWKLLTEDEKEIVLEALAWVINDEDTFYSFDSVCAHMSINPDYLRSKILRNLDLDTLDIIRLLQKYGWEVR